MPGSPLRTKGAQSYGDGLVGADGSLRGLQCLTFDIPARRFS